MRLLSDEYFEIGATLHNDCIMSSLRFVVYISLAYPFNSYFNPTEVILTQKDSVMQIVAYENL